jgi:hypothetical protein
LPDDDLYDIGILMNEVEPLHMIKAEIEMIEYLAESYYPVGRTIEKFEAD